VKLETRELGTGRRTAALVHGASMAGDVWRDFAQILIDDYDLSIVLVDLRGHGVSPRAQSYQVSDFVADLVDTLPTGLDFLMGQSLGGVSSAWASSSLQPRRYIGLDPAFTAGLFTALALRTLGRVQTRLPDRVLSAIGMPPKGAAPDTLERVHAMWANWDASMMSQLVSSGRRRPFPVGLPAVPSTLILADKSLFVPPQMVDELRSLGWDIRVKPGGEHDLHLQDPRGVITMLDDVLRDQVDSNEPATR
jgi:pimeloyl-ACP methyl ester carboxylesterase